MYPNETCGSFLSRSIHTDLAMAMVQCSPLDSIIGAVTYSVDTINLKLVLAKECKASIR